MKQKYYVELNRQEWRLIIEGLNRFRNKLIAAGRYTEAVDEILIKVAKANLSVRNDCSEIVSGRQFYKGVAGFSQRRGSVASAG